MSNQEEIGIVSFFHVRRGFGRIKTDRYPEGVFAHFSDVEDEAQILIPHELVACQINQGEKGPVATHIRRLTERLEGTIHRLLGKEWAIRGNNGRFYRFSPQDLLADNRGYHRLIAGWRVQFSPLEESGELNAHEIVICDTRTPFLQLVQADQWERKLSTLADIAEPEPWGDRESGKPLAVLENYLFETFRILHQENAIQSCSRPSGQVVSLWNTGLLSRNGEEIMARMDTLPPGKRGEGYLTQSVWRLSGFFPQSDRRIPALRKPLPLALEFVPHDKLVPDPTSSLIPDLDHLLKRDQRLPGFWAGLARQEQIQRLQGALHKLGLVLRRNPRLAIPQWYEESVQYLAPLDLGDGNGPVAALVLEEQDHHLRVQTILQLNWAYQNARLLGPQQGNWLAQWKAAKEGGLRGPRAIYWSQS